MRFLSKSPELNSNKAETITIIADYFEVYVKPNLEKLLQAQEAVVIKELLNHAKNDEENSFRIKLDKRYGATRNEEIKNILIVLRRLFQGQLEDSEPLMRHVLKNIKLKGSEDNRELIKEYNLLIRQSICEKMGEFLEARSLSPFRGP